MHACHRGRIAAIAAGVWLLAGTPVRADGGEIVIANQSRRELHLSLASGSDSGAGITLTFRDCLDPQRRASTTHLASSNQHQSIRSGETAVLSARDPAPCVQALRLTEAGQQTSCTFRYTVRETAGQLLGIVELDSAEPQEAFQKVDPDILIFWGS